ncbi:MAG: hypothetical protein GF333_03160 [Candidatus Omnitrophica bacterium]|nr:hypothetical protein [Candidatus Omnitrophota bacterium]
MKLRIEDGGVYHIFNRSIANFVIFHTESDYRRIICAFSFFQWRDLPCSFNRLLKRIETGQLTEKDILKKQIRLPRTQIIAYCLMPTHLHMILTQITADGIAQYMKNVQNSYTRYFNTKYHRKGPLWESRYKKVRVTTDNQLLHLTRYLHLNPVTAHLVDDPEQWPYSSYHEYLNRIPADERICGYEDVLEVKPRSYQKFVRERIHDQRDIAALKKFHLEDCGDHLYAKIPSVQS